MAVNWAVIRGTAPEILANPVHPLHRDITLAGGTTLIGVNPVLAVNWTIIRPRGFFLLWFLKLWEYRFGRKKPRKLGHIFNRNKTAYLTKMHNYSPFWEVDLLITLFLCILFLALYSHVCLQIKRWTSKLDCTFWWMYLQWRQPFYIMSKLHKEQIWLGTVNRGRGGAVWGWRGACLLICISFVCLFSVEFLVKRPFWWNDTQALFRWGSGQGWEQAETNSSFVLLPIQVFAYECTCSTTCLCLPQFTHDRFQAFGQRLA